MSAAEQIPDSRFVFVVGVARTGSKIYMTMLNRFSEIDIVNELHYLAPRFIRRDFVTTVQRRLGSRLEVASPEALVNEMFSAPLNGTFWQPRSSGSLEQRVTDLNRDTLVRRLSTGVTTPARVMRVLLEEHARVAGKSRPGAKFPVDISRVPTLLEWFPGASVIHLVRDPRAIYSSMIARDVRVFRGNWRQQAAARSGRLAYLVHQYRLAARVHRRNAANPAYYLSRFEDLIVMPCESVPLLCDFLGIEVMADMYQPPGKDSSFRKDESTGFDVGAVDTWREYLDRPSRRLIETLLSREMAIFGYDTFTPRNPRNAIDGI